MLFVLLLIQALCVAVNVFFFITVGSPISLVAAAFCFGCMVFTASQA